MSQPEKRPEQQPSARPDFKAAAKAILRDHPEIAGRTLFIDPATHEKTGSLRAHARGFLSGAFRKAVKKAGAGIIRTKHVDAVLFAAGNEPPDEALFRLHHDAARLIVPRGKNVDKFFGALFDIPYAAENAAADAYAAIRHLRSGGNGDLIGRIRQKRAAEFLHTGAPEHLTSFALDKIIFGGKAFTALKNEEVVEAVQKIVAAHTPSRADSDALVQEFAPLKGKPLDEAGLKLLAEIAQASKNPWAKELAGFLLPKAALPTPQPIAAAAHDPKSKTP
ncbi:MAG: hypothetical protein EPN97_17035 [Alphaproteobacteria bacterium]|nr:MAG: hypothetical protein EPN97_17035 [Alphaproteobacteria bacterium]